MTRIDVAEGDATELRVDNVQGISPRDSRTIHSHWNFRLFPRWRKGENPVLSLDLVTLLEDGKFLLINRNFGNSPTVKILQTCSQFGETYFALNCFPAYRWTLPSYLFPWYKQTDMLVEIISSQDWNLFLHIVNSRIIPRKASRRVSVINEFFLK